jgi:hypothetical protein
VLAAATRSAELLSTAGDLWELSNALALKMSALMALGHFEECDRIGQELQPLATRIGHYGALLICGRVQDSREFMNDPVFEKRVAFATSDQELILKAGIPWHLQSGLAVVLYWQGRWGEALQRCEEANASEAPGVFTGLDWSILFLVRSYAGEKEAALKMLRQKKTLMPNSMTLSQRVPTMVLLLRAARSSGLNARIIWRTAKRAGSATMTQRLLRRDHFRSIGTILAAVGLIEGLAVLGERKEAGKYCSSLSEALNSTGAVVGYLHARLVEPIAGMAAACAGRWG